MGFTRKVTFVIECDGCGKFGGELKETDSFELPEGWSHERISTSSTPRLKRLGTEAFCESCAMIKEIIL